MAGLTRICPHCGERIKGITTDWVLQERRIAGHQVCTIGTGWNASASIASAVSFQIASNMAAYKFDYDAKLNLGWYGTAWIKCPTKRDTMTDITFPR